MSKPSILLQLDSDRHPSVFDAVVAVDSGVDHLLQYGGIQGSVVADLIHGLMFTRGPQDLHRSAIFIGGSDVSAGEALLTSVTSCFFGPLRVSVMMDANGANTTAAAAVLAASKHVDLRDCEVLVLAATGPVGQRVIRLLAGEGARVRAGSRSERRALEVCEQVCRAVPQARLSAHGTADAASLTEAMDGVQAVISAGAPGVELLSEKARTANCDLRVAIDLNAVPPLGIAGVDVADRAKDHAGVQCYGAIGVGGTKMKIHKAALRKLFESNVQVLDAEQILSIGQQLADD